MAVAAATSSSEANASGPEVIRQELATKGYIFFGGQAVPPELEESYTKILSVLSSLSSRKGFHFLSRSVDTGDFWVSPEKVVPFKGEYRGEGRAVCCFNNEELYVNPLLHKLLQFTISVLPTHHRAGCYVSVMFSKHDHSVESLGSHHDNFQDTRDPNTSCYVAQFTLMRSSEGISGGKAKIYEDHTCIARRLNDKPLSGYIVDDDRLEHGASGIKVKEGSGASRNIVVFRIRRNAQPV